MEREISSRENPEVKRYLLLALQGKARREQKLFVTEGAILTEEAFAAGCRPVQLFATEEAFERYGEQLQPVALACETFCRISRPVAEKMAQAVSPQGAFGVFEMLDNRLQPDKISKEGCYMILASLQDPGNLGTILRTAAAFGADGLLLTADCPDLYSLKVLRASMGGVWKVPVGILPTAAEAVALLRQNGLLVYAAALSGAAKPLQPGMLGKGCAVLVGNEGAGLPDNLLNCCDGALVLPMCPGSESLNAAMAAGIFLWEMTR